MGAAACVVQEVSKTEQEIVSDELVDGSLRFSNSEMMCNMENNLEHLPTADGGTHHRVF